MLTALVFVKDVERMRSFYARGLDLVEDAVASSDGYVVLTGAGTRLALHAIPPDVGATITIEDPPIARSATPIKLVFAVPDLAPALDRLRGLGAPTFPTGDDDAFDVLDPEGNVIAIRSIAAR